MGIANIKWEADIFQITQQQLQIPGTTPVETKPDIGLLTQIASQVAQLTVSVNQLHQAVAGGQAFTRPVQQGLGEATVGMEEIRKLNQRLDDLEARLPAAHG